MFKKTENKRKRGRGWPKFKKSSVDVMFLLFWIQLFRLFLNSSRLTCMVKSKLPSQTRVQLNEVSEDFILLSNDLTQSCSYLEAIYWPVHLILAFFNYSTINQCEKCIHQTFNVWDFNLRPLYHEHCQFKY